MQKKSQTLYSSYLVTCILNAFLCFSAIMLNMVTIQAIRKTSSLSKTLKTMLLSLAVSDLGVGLLVQPLYIILCALFFKQVSKSDASYKITFNAFLVSTNLFASASFFDVMALIADRFLGIHSYLRYQKLVTHKRVVAVVTSIWVFSVFLSLIRLWLPKSVVFATFGIIVLASIITTTSFSVKIYLNVRYHMNQIQVLQSQNGEMANMLRLRKFAIAAVYVYSLCGLLFTKQLHSICSPIH